MTPARAGVLLAAPALAAIAVFFFIPVAVALALSLTDFDIYALADIANLPIHRPAQLPRAAVDAAVLAGARQYLVLHRRRMPVSIGASLGAALLLDSRLARARGLLRTALFAPVVTTLVAVAIIWRYLLPPRATD